VVLCLFVSTLFAAEVTVDCSVTFQTMEGVGASDRIGPWVKCNPFCADVPLDNFYDSLINVAGFTLIRVMGNVHGCGFSPSPDSFSMEYLREVEFDHMVRLTEVAEASDEPFYVIPSIYGPPPYVKYNNMCPGTEGGRNGYWADTTNTIDPAHYEDYGRFCATYISWARDSLGLWVYGFSPANEPCFNTEYPSVTFGGGIHYGRMLAVVGPMIHAAAPRTLIYGCEVLTRDFPSWEIALVNRVPEAAPHLNRFAFHAYGADGQTIDTGRVSALPDDQDGVVWMSEAGYEFGTHDDGMKVARTIMGMFNRGVSLWNHNGLITNQHHLIAKGVDGVADGTPTPGYWAHAHFARFARPGWKRISAQCDNEDIMVSAYAHAATQGLSVIAINSSSSTQSLTMSISGGPVPEAFEGKMTSPEGNYVDMGAVSPSQTITMPANSIVSLGYNHRGTLDAALRELRVARSAPRPRIMRPSGVAVRYYDIAGRRILSTRALGRTRRASQCLITVQRGRAVRSVVRSGTCWDLQEPPCQNEVRR